MDDKEQLLKQIGWSDELIQTCLSPDNEPTLELSHIEYEALVPSHQDVTNLVVATRTPAITDGSNL